MEWACARCELAHPPTDYDADNLREVSQWTRSHRQRIGCDNKLNIQSPHCEWQSSSKHPVPRAPDALAQLQPLHFLVQLLAHLRGAACHDDARPLQRVDLVLGTALAARNDGTSVAHATTRGRSETGDERDHRLGLDALVVLQQVFGGLLLSNSADLADHDDALGLGIAQEDLQAVDEVGAVEGVAADAHAQRLAQTDLGGLVHGLVGEGARPRHDSDAAPLVDVAGHDADLAALRGDDAGAVGADQTALALTQQRVFDADHVVLGDALSDAHNQSHLGLHRLHDRLGRTRRRHVDDGDVAFGRILGLLDLECVRERGRAMNDDRVRGMYTTRIPC